MLTRGFALGAPGHPHRGPIEHDGRDRSPGVKRLEGDAVEDRHFFERGEARREGAAAPAGGDVHQDDPSS